MYEFCAHVGWRGPPLIFRIHITHPDHESRFRVRVPGPKNVTTFRAMPLYFDPISHRHSVFRFCVRIVCRNHMCGFRVGILRLDSVSECCAPIPCWDSVARSPVQIPCLDPVCTLQFHGLFTSSTPRFHVRIPRPNDVSGFPVKIPHPRSTSEFLVHILHLDSESKFRI